LEASHLRVIREQDGVETVLVLGSDYTVSGAGASAGAVTLVAALPVGQTLTVVRNVPATQDADYVVGDAFPAESHEEALDKLTMLTQQLQEQVDRAAKLPVTSDSDSQSLIDDIVRLADSADNIDTVVANLADVTTVASDLNEPVSEINTVAGAIVNVNAVGNNIANVNTVAGNISAVNSAATNMAAIIAAPTQASNAAASASAAATSETNAAASAAAAATALDNFDDRYLGPKTSNPTVDNDGNPLVVGALYYRSTAPVGMKVYDGAQWIEASAAQQAALVTFEYVATAGQTTFTGADANGLTLSYITGGLVVALNGVVLRPGDDFTASTGTSVVLAVGATAGDELMVFAFSSFVVANTYTQAQADAAFLPKANPSYTGTLTGGTGVVNLGSGQFYKDASGNVGIGTSSPDIFSRGDQRNVAIAAAGASDNLALALNAGGSAGRGAQIYIGQGGTRHLTLASNVTESTVETTSSTPLKFGTNNTERARIDSSGNLLVGKTTAGESQGSGNGFSFQPDGGGAYFSMVQTSSGTGNACIYLNRLNSSGSMQIFQRNNSTVGSISHTTSSVAYNTSSDYRLKHDIQPMNGALAKVTQLKPVTYKWNVDDSQSQGFIAHELQEVVPECVTGEKDAVDAEGNPKYQGIDTSFLVATLTAAIQEQQAIIEQLKADVEALKAQA
jgi:hypothetical protein